MNSNFREIFRGVTAGFVAILAIVGGIVSIMVVPGLLRTIALLCVFVGLTLLAGWRLTTTWIQNRKADKVIPRSEDLDATLEGGASKEAAKYVVVQASKQDIQWTVQLRADCYPGTTALSKDLLEEWYDANPNGFFIIKEKNGSRVGHLDLLPIRPGTLRLLLEGKITEKEVRGDSLYSPEDMEQVTDIYCEGIIIQAPEGTPKNRATMVKAVAMRNMLSEVPSILARICNPQRLQTVYAVAASNSGKDVLRHLGFEVQLKGEYRKDQDDLYQAEFTILKDKLRDRYGTLL